MLKDLRHGARSLLQRPGLTAVALRSCVATSFQSRSRNHQPPRYAERRIVHDYAVAQRTHEIGVRMALGAQSRDVLARRAMKADPLVALRYE